MATPHRTHAFMKASVRPLRNLGQVSQSFVEDVATRMV